MPFLSWLILFGVVAALLAVIALAVRRMERGHKRAGAVYVTEADPLVERRATVAEKFVGHRRMGWRDPANRTGFLVTFQLEDGDALTYSLSPELFESLRPGERGLLVTQGGNYVDFGDRAAVKLPEDGDR